MNRRLVIAAELAALCIMPAGLAQAEDRARPVDLEDLLTIAVRTSPQLARARFDRDRARGLASAAASVDELTVSAEVDWISLTNPLAPGQPIQNTANQGATVRAGLGRNLPGGGALDLALESGQIDHQYALLDGDGAVTATRAATSATGAVSLSFSQPLLRGRGADVARGELKKARVSRDAALLQLEQQATGAVLAVIIGYWDLVLAREELLVRRQAVELAEEQLDSVRAAIRTGALPRSESLVIEHQIAVRQQAELSAEVELMRRALRVRRDTGMEMGPGQLALSPTADLTPDRTRLSLDRSIEAALERNPAIALAAADARTAAIDRDMAGSQSRPTLDFHASVASRGAATDPGSVIDQIAGFDAPGWSAGLRFSYQLGGSLGRGLVAAAEAELGSARLSAREVERDLIGRVAEAVYVARAARRQVVVGRKAVELAEANLLAERDRFRAGRTRVFEVLERQDLLQQARLELVRAIRHQRVSIAELEVLTGDLLDRYGIIIE